MHCFPNLMFSSYQPVSDVENLLSPACIDWKQKRLSLCYMSLETIPISPPVLHIEHSIQFFIVLLRLMYDVSAEPLSQNRAKPLSRDPSDQHVLSIWTLPAPPQAFSAVSLNCCHAAKIRLIFPPKIIMWVQVVVDIVMVFVLFHFTRSIYWLTGYWWLSYHFASSGAIIWFISPLM